MTSATLILYYKGREHSIEWATFLGIADRGKLYLRNTYASFCKHDYFIIKLSDTKELREKLTDFKTDITRSAYIKDNFCTKDSLFTELTDKKRIEQINDVYFNYLSSLC